jgi:hypothetical protein
MNRYNHRKTNDDTPMYAFIGIVLIGVGIQMNIIKIPSMNTRRLASRERKSQQGASRERKSQQGASDEGSDETPGDKFDAIPCQYDCSSIPGSSCVNGKCTDPYLQL